MRLFRCRMQKLVVRPATTAQREWFNHMTAAGHHLVVVCWGRDATRHTVWSTWMRKRPNSSINEPIAALGVAVILDELIERIGHQTTLDLVRGWGSRRVYIPKFPHPESALALRIGLDATVRLSAARGGDTIELPAARSVLLRRRDQAVVEQLANGTETADVAVDFGLSERHVRHIRDVQSHRY